MDIAIAPAGAKPTQDSINAKAMRNALLTLSTEYAERGDNSHARLINVTLVALTNADLARLHSLIMRHDTAQQALDSIDPR